MNRFKMDFGNSNNQQLIRQFLNDKKTIKPPSNSPLNLKMIDRIYKARSGCSACGKKVM